MLRVVGGAAGDADGQGSAGGCPGDAVGDGSIGDAWGLGAAGDADGEGAASGAPGVGAAGDANGEAVAADAMVDGAADDALTVRVLQMPDVGTRTGGGRWFWALATPGRGSSGRCRSLGAPVLAVLVASGVRAAPCQSWRRVPLVLVMVSVMDVIVLLMWMLL